MLDLVGPDTSCGGDGLMDVLRDGQREVRRNRRRLTADEPGTGRCCEVGSNEIEKGFASWRVWRCLLGVAIDQGGDLSSCLR